MPRRAVLVTFVLATAALLVAARFVRVGPPPPQPTATTAHAPPGVEYRTYHFAAANKDMEYALFVPSTYDKTRTWPLVVLLHGLAGTPRQIINLPSLTAAAERHGYLLVAPMGYNERGWYGAPIRRPRPGDPPNLSELSEQDVMNVLAIVRRDYAVDDTRMYLAGYSMGGGGTWELGIKHPDLWAALAPVAPATRRPATDVARVSRLPVILVQGAKDEIVRPQWVRPWAHEMKHLGMTHEYLELSDATHWSVTDALPEVFKFFDKHTKPTTKTMPTVK